MSPTKKKVLVFQEEANHRLVFLLLLFKLTGQYVCILVDWLLSKVNLRLVIVRRSWGSGWKKDGICNAM